MGQRPKHVPLATIHRQTRSHGRVASALNNDDNTGKFQLGIVGTIESDGEGGPRPPRRAKLNLLQNPTWEQKQPPRKRKAAPKPDKADDITSDPSHTAKKARLPPPQAKPHTTHNSDDGDNELNDDGEAGSDSQSDDSEEDELDDASDIEVQDYEVPQIISDNDNDTDGNDSPGPEPTSRTQAVAIRTGKRPGTKAANKILNEPSVATQEGTALKKPSWEQKGANETATIHHPTSSQAKHAPFGDDYHDSLFLPSSDIILTRLPGGGVQADMGSQTVLMQGVLHRAIQIGRRYLGFGCKALHSKLTVDNAMEMVVPFSPDGLAEYSYHALVEAATALGHGGITDIAGRLELELPRCYRKPLVAIVAHRLGLTRTSIKKSIEQLVHIHCSFAGAGGVDSLLADHSYIYPQKDGGALDRGKPFYASIVVPTLAAAFFGPDGLGILYPKWFPSSCQDLGHEHEITMPMMAMCMTLVEICLREYQTKTRIELKGSGFDNTFRTHMVLLLGLQARRRGYFHRLMHSALQSARANTVQSDAEATGDQLLASIDWEQVAVDHTE